MDLPATMRAEARRVRQPEWIDPMLATLTDRRFSDPSWIFEDKLDGERCLAFKKGGSVRLLSRNKLTLNNTYPEVVDALARAKHDLIIDGEVVAFDGKRSSFEKLQHRIGIRDPEEARRSSVQVFYYVFDLIHFDGYDLSEVELIGRKSVLERAIDFKGSVRFLTHRDTDGVAFYKQACRQGLEGLIAKRRDSTYQHRRSPDWLKFKCVNEQELVIGGFTDPQRSRVGFGALLVGYYEGGKLRYAGKVGTGFDTETLTQLRRKLDRRSVARSPFTKEVVKDKGAHWVRPELVAQIGFTEWTRDGKLRHPRFMGLRTDKSAKEVVRERPG